MQRSANNACLAEAKSYVNAAVSEMAIDGKVTNAYTPSACDKVDDTAKTKFVANGKLDGGQGTTTATFTPKTRGTASEVRTTICDLKTASCKLSAAAPASSSS